MAYCSQLLDSPYRLNFGVRRLKIKVTQIVLLDFGVRGLKFKVIEIFVLIHFLILTWQTQLQFELTLVGISPVICRWFLRPLCNYIRTSARIQQLHYGRACMLYSHCLLKGAWLSKQQHDLDVLTLWHLW